MEALLENIRFLAGYRRSALIAEALVPLVLDVAVSPCTVRDVERRLADRTQRVAVRPVTLDLLWQSRLIADLTCRLGGDTLIGAGATA